MLLQNINPTVKACGPVENYLVAKLAIKSNQYGNCINAFQVKKGCDALRECVNASRRYG